MTTMRWLAMTTLLAGATACGGGGSSATPDSNPTQPDAHGAAPDAASPDATPSSGSTVTIASTGGSISFEGVTITFPAGAVTSATDFTLSRQSPVFLAGNGMPDGFCAFTPRYLLVPAMTFPVSAQPTLSMTVAAAAPNATVALTDVTNTTFGQIFGSRTGNTVTALLPNSGTFFHGQQQITALNPTSGAAAATITASGYTFGVTGVDFVSGGSVAGSATLTQAGELATFTVPSVTPGAYDVDMVFAPWECGNVPGGFTVTP